MKCNLLIYHWDKKSRTSSIIQTTNCCQQNCAQWVMQSSELRL